MSLDFTLQVRPGIRSRRCHCSAASDYTKTKQNFLRGPCIPGAGQAASNQKQLKACVDFTDVQWLHKSSWLGRLSLRYSFQLSICGFFLLRLLFLRLLLLRLAGAYIADGSNAGIDTCTGFAVWRLPFPLFASVFLTSDTTIAIAMLLRSAVYESCRAGCAAALCCSC